MRGFVSVSNSNTLTQMSQSIFRLRNINIGHSIDYYIDKKFFSSRQPNISDYLNKIISNEEKYKLNTLNNLMIQFIKFLQRYTQNNPQGYLETLYYNVKKYEGEFLTQEDFFSKEIFEPISKKLSTNSIILKNFLPDPTKTKVNINLQLNTEINLNINVNVNRNTVKDLFGTYTFEDKPNVKYINILNIDNPTDFSETINLVFNSKEIKEKSNLLYSLKNFRTQVGIHYFIVGKYYINLSDVFVFYLE
jgi:hypothetical protein